MPSKSVLRLFAIAAGLVLCLAMAGSARTENRPPDIKPRFWHALSETAGIALSEQRKMSGETELHGTLMIRRDHQWQAVYLVLGDATVIPAR